LILSHSDLKRIKPLTDDVKKKIAAGEVIEGPFSIVKELVENAIDAESTDISVEVFEGGLKKILIRDNGHGIAGDDMELAIMEHATSKIEDIHDIEKITSYGFRGEALSSISSVSSMTLISRSRDENTGVRLASFEGSVSKAPFAGSAGTTVIVENLFYNIPARKKFLKAVRTEVRKIREIFLNITLANPGISFSLDIDGKRQVTLPAVPDLRGRIEQVYGREISGHLIFEKIEDIKVTVSGFLSGPGFMRKSRSMQCLFINNRVVEYRFFGYILSRAFEAIAEKGAYPAAVIFIDIDPGLVDVNIHPAKREVRFFDQKYIDSLLYQFARKALNREQKIEMIPGGTDTAGTAGKDTSVSDTRGLMFIGGPGDGVPEGPSFQGPSTLREVEALYREIEGDGKRIKGTLFDTYIIVEHNGSMSLIDFHAAHERIIYDRLLASEAHEKQELLIPLTVDLPLHEHRLIMDNIDVFSEIGFDIEDFSDNSIIIRAVPEMVKDFDGAAFVNEFIENLRDEKGPWKTFGERVAAAAACHSSRRAGDRLHGLEMRSLVDSVLSGRYELRCPHGRPYVYTVTKNDLEKMFRRQ